MNALTRAFTPVLLMGPIVLLGLAAEVANADTIYVCWDGSGDYLTIQAGIDAASDGDEVVVCDGTYTGDGNRDLDFHGKAITVCSASGDPALCIIDCEDDGRGFYFHSGEGPDSIVEGLTITNGYLGYGYGGGGVYCDGSSPTLTNCTISGNSAGSYGGGVYCDRSSPTFTNCTIGGNSAQYWDGGGVYCTDNSSPILTNCTVSGNSAHWDGGGVYCYYNSSPTLINCTISANSASDSGGGVYCEDNSVPTLTNCAISANSASDSGGGVYCDGSSPTLTNCTISGSWATGGGAVYCFNNSSPTVDNCTISGNSASDSGGAVKCLVNSSPTFTNCTITGNSAGFFGGAVRCHNNSSPTLINCTISGNSTGDDGGGVYCSLYSNATLTNCIISGNSASDKGGGVHCSHYASLTFTNCTISRNSADDRGGGVYCYASSPTLTNCILWSDAPQEIYVTSGSPVVTYCDIEGGWAGEGNIDADPQFAFPDDFHLMPGSPCIDAADNEAVPADEFDLDEDGDTDEPIPFDLDGNPRFVDDPATEDTGNGTPPIVDMGAYEFQGGILAFLDIKPGSCPNPLNRNSQGVLPVALVGTEDVDVTQVDLDSLELTRADGIGGSVTPLMGPPGPGIHVEDVATPFDGEPCDCHELEGDGIADLAMKFDTPEMVAVLELEDLAGGSSVELVVSGELMDTTHFSAADCVVLVPPVPGPGALPAQSGPEGNGIDAVPESPPNPRPADPDAAQGEDAPDELSPPPVACGVLPPGFLLTAAAGMYLISRARPVARRPE